MEGILVKPIIGSPDPRRICTSIVERSNLTVRQYFRDDKEIVSLATKIYERVDFRWMLNGDPQLLSHGWKPETGFLKPRWDTYSEDTLLYLLAIGSPTHSLSPTSWYALWRDRYRYAGYAYFTTIGVPLFMHQYAHAWIDYRNRRETQGDRIDYFENSINATLAHRASAKTSRTSFRRLGQTSGESPLLTALRVISPGVDHRSNRRSMALWFLRLPAAR